MKDRLRLAAGLGCEVFVVDAGWYGLESDWSDCVGDWREKIDGAFEGKIIDFAAEVRGYGMGFGLWMEPERISAKTPIYKEHPEYFNNSGNGFFYPQLWSNDVFDYIKRQIEKIIELYSLSWIKIDFNGELEEDSTYSGRFYYYEAWYRLIDELKEIHSEVFFEACASGGLRCDIRTMSHFDGHFLSDNVNPQDAFSMYEQLIMRNMPGRINRWLVLQKGASIPTYFRNISDTEPTIIVPSAPGSGFGDYESIQLDFLCKLIFHGIAGISGDIGSLDESDLNTIAEFITFYKKWRNFLRTACVRLDSEPSKIGQRNHWRSMEFFRENDEPHLVFVYRFNDIAPVRQIFPINLIGSVDYEVNFAQYHYRESGSSIMRDGIEVILEQRNRAEIIVLKPLISDSGSQ